MRIALYHNATSGGAKRAIFELTSRLAQRHLVDVYTLSTANEEFCDLRPVAHAYRVFPFYTPRQYSSPIGRLNSLERWRHLHRLDRLARRIAAVIDAGRYDVVFAQISMWTGAPLILRYLESASVYYCQEPPRDIYEPIPPLADSAGRGRLRSALDRVDPLRRLHHSTVQQMDRDAARAAQLVLVNSKFSQCAARRAYAIDPKVCYLGVDTTIFQPQPSIVRQNYILSVGAIQPRKGFDFLIESIGRIPAPQRPDLRLVGNVEVPEFRRSLEHLAVRHGVTLHIEVGVSEELLVHRYNEALLFAYAPQNEPFGLAPLEALACNTPVVGVAEGGVRESVTDGVGGILVDRDPSHFADALCRLLEQPELRASYSEQAREYVLKHWTWDVATERVEQYLASVATGVDGQIPAFGPSRWRWP